MDIQLSSNVVKDRYTDYIQEHYDLSVDDVVTEKIPFNFSLNSLDDWSIGLICGGSGSGKSTIMSRLGNSYEPSFTENKSIISDFEGLEPSDVIELFCAVGLCFLMSRGIGTQSNI